MLQFQADHFEAQSVAFENRGSAMLLLLLILVVLLVVGGGGGYYGRRAGWGARNYGLGLVLLILIVVALVWTLNELLMPPVPMPAGTPSIVR